MRPQLLCAESTNNTLRALFFEMNRHHNSSLRLGLHTRARIVKFVHHNSAAKTLRSSWRSLRKKGKSDGLVRRSQRLRESEAGKESLEHSSEVNRPTCKRKSTEQKGPRGPAASARFRRPLPRASRPMMAMTSFITSSSK